MKDIFCASPASTAICSSMDQRSILRPGTRPIDRRHRLGEPPKNRPNAAPCSSHLPIDPAACKSRKSTNTLTENLRRKSSADVDDLNSSKHLLSDKPYVDFILNNERAIVTSQPVRSFSHRSEYEYPRLIKPASAAGSPRLVSFSHRSEYESPRLIKPASVAGSPRLVKPTALGKESPVYHVKAIQEKVSLGDHLIVHKSSPVFVPPKKQQVVELRVSIHCKGCEGKLRKHISRMEGVTSFSIDLETKKVRVIGNVTPLGVLTSISKVKNAQFWPSPASSLSSSSSAVSSPRVSVTK